MFCTWHKAIADQEIPFSGNNSIGTDIFTSRLYQQTSEFIMLPALKYQILFNNRLEQSRTKSWFPINSTRVWYYHEYVVLSNYRNIIVKKTLINRKNGCWMVRVYDDNVSQSSSLFVDKYWKNIVIFVNISLFNMQCCHKVMNIIRHSRSATVLGAWSIIIRNIYVRSFLKYSITIWKQMCC